MGFSFSISFPLTNCLTKVPDFYFSSLAEKENKPQKKKLKKQLREGEPLDLSPMTDLFMCTKCTKSYRLRHSLTRHLKFECGKEPMYACHLCDRKFKHKYDLNVHERGKHGVKIKNENTENKLESVKNFHVTNGGNDRNSFSTILGTKN